MPVRRRIMQSNRSRDTRPEIRLRQELYALGLRYRVAQHPIAGFRRTADVVFRPTKIAVFVDGCFWHSCPQHGSLLLRNRDYWVSKLDQNVRRDAETNSVLKAHGWQVIRVWEHEVAAQAATRIARRVKFRRKSLPYTASKDLLLAAILHWPTCAPALIPTANRSPRQGASDEVPDSAG